MEDVHNQLEIAGVQSFSDAFAELMDVIEKKSNDMRAQIGDLTDLTAARIEKLSKLMPLNASMPMMQSYGHKTLKVRKKSAAVLVGFNLPGTACLC